MIDIFFWNTIYLVMFAVKIGKFMQDFKQSKYVIDEEISEKSWSNCHFGIEGIGVTWREFWLLLTQKIDIKISFKK